MSILEFEDVRRAVLNNEFPPELISSWNRRKGVDLEEAARQYAAIMAEKGRLPVWLAAGVGVPTLLWPFGKSLWLVSTFSHGAGAVERLELTFFLLSGDIGALAWQCVIAFVMSVLAFLIGVAIWGGGGAPGNQLKEFRSALESADFKIRYLTRYSYDQIRTNAEDRLDSIALTIIKVEKAAEGLPAAHHKEYELRREASYLERKYEAYESLGLVEGGIRECYRRVRARLYSPVTTR